MNLQDFIKRRGEPVIAPKWFRPIQGFGGEAASIAAQIDQALAEDDGSAEEKDSGDDELNADSPNDISPEHVDALELLEDVKGMLEYLASRTLCPELTWADRAECGRLASEVNEHLEDYEFSPETGGVAAKHEDPLESVEDQERAHFLAELEAEEGYKDGVLLEAAGL